MVDLEKCKKEFLKYTEKYDLNKENIKRKQLHSLRVMEDAKKIAEALKLNQEEIELAQLIGLLHDIGRFEQYSRNNRFLNEKLLDHARLGVEVLQENNYIEKYINNKKYINIIFKTIENHNKYRIDKTLNEEEMLFAKIIRDADKIDILYEGTEIYWNSEREKNSIENSKISIKIEQQFKNELQIKKIGNEKNDTVDGVLILLSYIYDINFWNTLKIISDANYAEKIISRFEFKDEETKEKIEKLKDILFRYIKINLKK